MNDLTLEEQKLLTVEGLGECWHELPKPSSNIGDMRLGGALYCTKCGKDIRPSPFKSCPPRPDFTDWRVVGRLIDQFKRKSVHMVTVQELKLALFSENPQLAICRAIAAWLKEKKNV